MCERHAAINLSFPWSNDFFSKSSINLLRDLLASVSPSIIIGVKKADAKVDERSSSSTARHVLVSKVHGHDLVALPYEMKIYSKGFLV